MKKIIYNKFRFDNPLNKIEEMILELIIDNSNYIRDEVNGSDEYEFTEKDIDAFSKKFNIIIE
jgi:hypothetical protein